MTKYFSRYLDDREVHRRWVDPRLANVRVADLRTYLLRKGWVPVTADRPGVLVFREPTGTEDGPLYQFVPDSEQGRDYLARLYDLLAAVAEVENRCASDLLADVLSAAAREGPNGAPVGNSLTVTDFGVGRQGPFRGKGGPGERQEIVYP